jgi:methionine sulfoxide reductase heme-binding subunit
VRSLQISDRAVLFAWLKRVCFVLAMFPLLRLVFAAFFGWFDGLGANPIELITRSTGTWTLVLLCITLSMTPLRKISGFPEWIGMRRMFGLYTFFYSVLHFITYIWFDQWFDIGSIAADIVKRPYITAGFTAFVLLVPLALTSTKAMMKRLGRRWLKLHSLIYFIAPIAVAHYWWHKAAKNAITQPAMYAVVVAILLGFRVVTTLRRRTNRNIQRS